PDAAGISPPQRADLVEALAPRSTHQVQELAAQAEPVELLRERFVDLDQRLGFVRDRDQDAHQLRGGPFNAHPRVIHSRQPTWSLPSFPRISTISTPSRPARMQVRKVEPVMTATAGSTTCETPIA